MLTMLTEWISAIGIFLRKFISVASLQHMRCTICNDLKAQQITASSSLSLWKVNRFFVTEIRRKFIRCLLLSADFADR